MKYLFYIFICLSAYACVNTKPSVSNQTLPDSVRVTIVAKNLTEDLSSFSSKKDEVIILLYKNDSSLQIPFLRKEHTFTKRGDSLNFKVHKTALQHSLFVLLEKDTEDTISIIENRFRKNHLKIKQAHKNSDYNLLEKLLGDDDVIGVKNIQILPTSFNFSGVYKLDRFEYETFITY